jgi:hypothetical protein
MVAFKYEKVMVKLGWTDNFDSKFKKCYGTFPELDSWANTLYQDKKFPTRVEFNAAYDRRDPLLHRGDQVVILTPEDLERFEHEVSEGEFEENYSKCIKKLKALFECEKIVFFY